MRLCEFTNTLLHENNVDKNNAEYDKTNYPRANDDTMYTNNTFGDNLAYQNHASRKNTAQQNRINGAAKDANYTATMAAQSQHTAPIYATQEEWNQWVRQGDLEYARAMDLHKKTNKAQANFDTDNAERQAYIRSQNKISQTRLPDSRYRK